MTNTAVDTVATKTATKTVTADITVGKGDGVVSAARTWLRAQGVAGDDTLRRGRIGKAHLISFLTANPAQARKIAVAYGVPVNSKTKVSSKIATAIVEARSQMVKA